MAPVTLVTPRVGFPVSLATSERFSPAHERLRVAFVPPERHEAGIWRRRGRFRLDGRDAAAAVPRRGAERGRGRARGSAAGQRTHCSG